MAAVWVKRSAFRVRVPWILFWLFFLRMIIIWVSFSENYRDCLNDVKAATALQPSYLKAIIRGENESQLKIWSLSDFMRNDKWVDFFSLGANTCLKLKKFEEAIIWCDKGLAVSFLRWIHATSLHNYCFFFLLLICHYQIIFFSFQ